MKKFSILTLTLMIAFAFVAMPAVAGNCGASKANASVDKKACGSSKVTTAKASDETEAQMASSKSCASKASAETKAHMAGSKSCASKASSETKAHMTGSKSCDGSKTTTASATKAKSCAKTCGVEAAKACAGAEGVKTAKTEKKVDATMASASGECPTTGKCQDVTLAIKGMTCTGCEAMVTKALMAHDGIYKVASIDYKSGTAKVCIDPAKMEGSKVASLVSSSGYETTVTHAAAVHEAGSKETKACSDKKDNKKIDY